MILINYDPGNATLGDWYVSIDGVTKWVRSLDAVQRLLSKHVLNYTVVRLLNWERERDAVMLCASDFDFKWAHNEPEPNSYAADPITCATPEEALELALSYARMLTV